jgi:hypothetical protein
MDFINLFLCKKGVARNLQRRELKITPLKADALFFSTLFLKGKECPYSLLKN